MNKQEINKIRILKLNLMVGSILLSMSTCVTATPYKASIHTVLLGIYLSQAGTRLKCYFTVENDAHSYRCKSPTGKRSEGWALDSMMNQYIKNNQPKTINQLIRQLKFELPNVRIIQDKKNPKIIHLVARSLEMKQNYVMNKTTSYNGRTLLWKLPDILGQHFNGLLSHSYFPMLTGSTADNSTIVDVSALKMPVREILSDFVPLTGYNSIIWQSNYLHKTPNSSSETLVIYFGPIN